MRRVKWARQEIERTFALDFAVEIGEDHWDIAAKFPNDLTTGPAGRRERHGIGDNCDGVEFAFAFGDGFENGDTFRADREAVARVFDVASGEDAARFGAHGGADAKMGEWRMRLLPSRAGGSYELIVSGHGKIMHRNGG